MLVECFQETQGKYQTILNNNIFYRHRRNQWYPQCLHCYYWHDPVYTHGCMTLCTYLRRPEVNTGYLHQSLSTAFFKTSLCTGLVSSRNPLISALITCTEVRDTGYHCVLRIQIRSSSLHDTYSNHWAISVAPTLVGFYFSVSHCQGQLYFMCINKGIKVKQLCGNRTTTTINYSQDVAFSVLHHTTRPAASWEGMPHHHHHHQNLPFCVVILKLDTVIGFWRDLFLCRTL